MSEDYEKKNREELKIVCKQKGVTRYHNWSKTKMIEEIRKKDFIAIDGTASAETVELDDVAKLKSETPAVEIPKGLSDQAKKWQMYFQRTDTTAAKFLTRYPKHKFRTFIEELID